MALRKFAITSVLALMVFVAAPAKASADWLFTPFFGMNWGGNAEFTDFAGDFEDEFEQKMNFGASLSWMGAGAFGFEVDFGYSPNFFQNTAGDDDFEYGDSNVTTLMANLKVGAPFGGQTGGGIRPYASGGLGLIKSRIDDPDDLFELDGTRLGLQRRWRRDRVLQRQLRPAGRRPLFPLAPGQRAGRRVRSGAGVVQLLARHGRISVPLLILGSRRLRR